MAFYSHRTIRLGDTDATGVLYFTHQLRIALETFEEFIDQSGLSVSSMIEEKKILLPIVHVESDFLLPLKVGDLIDISLIINNIGMSSFTCSSRFKRNDQMTGTTSIVHVFCSAEKNRPQPIPDAYKKILQTLNED